jgi:DnaJ-class molecular chaperone
MSLRGGGRGIQSAERLHMKTCPDSNGVKTCPDCNGDGVVDKDTDNEHQCPTCGGLGFVSDDEEEIREGRVEFLAFGAGFR